MLRSGPTLLSSSRSLEGSPPVTFAQSPTVLRSLGTSGSASCLRLPLVQPARTHLSLRLCVTISRYLAVQSQEDHHEEEAAGPERREGQHHHSPGVGDESQAGACSKEQRNTFQCLGGLQATCDPKAARCGSGFTGARGNLTPKLPSSPPSSPGRSHPDLHLVPKSPRHHPLCSHGRNRT